MKRAAGFTLIEVMAALTIFMVGIVGVLALLASGLALHRDAMRKATVAIASDDVRGRVEAWLATAGQSDSAELPKIEGLPVEGYNGYFYSADLAVDPQQGPKGGVVAKVFVYGRDLGKQRGSEFLLFVRPGEQSGPAIRRALEGRRDETPAGAPPAGAPGNPPEKPGPQDKSDAKVKR